MLTIEEIQALLKDRKLNAVAKVCEISYPTILKIANGPHKQVSYEMVKKVSDYLEGKND